MKTTKKNAIGYNEKNPVQPEGSITPDNKHEKQIPAENSSPNENLSIPERRLKNHGKNDDPVNRS